MYCSIKQNYDILTYVSNIKQKISLICNNRTTTNCAVQPRVTSDDINAESDGK